MIGLVAALGLGWWLLGDSGGAVADVVRERPAVDALQPRGDAVPSSDAKRRAEVVAEARRRLEKVREASASSGAAGGLVGSGGLEPDEEDAEPEIYPMDREGIRAAISASSKEIKLCYETLLQSYPDTSGRIDVRFEIEGRGDHSIVSGAEVTDETMNSRYMTGCVLTAMEDITFDAADDGKLSTVSWPFVFRNAE